MRRYLIVMLGGFVIGGVGVQTYRHVHERPAEVASPVQVKTVSVDSVPDGDVQAVLEELGRMKPGISLSDWKQAHPEDQIESEVKLDACAALRSSKPLADGNTLTREAEFYPPNPPQGMALPLNQDAAGLISSCTLASVRVELQVDGREKLLRSVPQIQAEFAERLGQPDAKLAPYSYPLGPPWHAGEASVVIEKNGDVNPLFASNRVSNTLRVRWQSRASLVTYAYLPRVLEDKKERASEQNEVVSPETSPEVFDLAMRTAGVDRADLVKTMNDLYQDCYQHPRLSASDASYQERRTTPGLERGKKAVDALTQWLNLTRDLSAPRKAGALLAAYFLLTDATDRLDNTEMEAMRDWLLENKVNCIGEGARAIGDEREVGERGVGFGSGWADRGCGHANRDHQSAADAGILAERIRSGGDIGRAERRYGFCDRRGAEISVETARSGADRTDRVFHRPGVLRSDSDF